MRALQGERRQIVVVTAEWASAYLPHVITDVHTTPAPVSDTGMTTPIQADLAARNLLPREHLVDAGYVRAETLVDSQRKPPSRSRRPGSIWIRVGKRVLKLATIRVNSFGLDATGRDLSTRPSQCVPGGQDIIHMPQKWSPSPSRTTIAKPARLARKCTRGPSKPRQLRVRGQAYHEALQAARQRQTTPTYRKAYAARAALKARFRKACAGVISVKRVTSGLAKTHLQQLLTATALNLLRVVAWQDNGRGDGLGHRLSNLLRRPRRCVERAASECEFASRI